MKILVRIRKSRNQDDTIILRKHYGWTVKHEDIPHFKIFFFLTGECWSAENGDDTYYKDKSVSTCVNKCYQPCRCYDSICVGMGYTNYVYRVTTGEN